MLKDAAVNAGAPDLAPGPWSRVSGMQAKLHHWAAADPGCRFGDLFNLVHDPATLKAAWDRVAGNTGARSAGVDGRTAADVEQDLGVQKFLDDLRSAVKAGTFRPVPVRERMIPKPWLAGGAMSTASRRHARRSTGLPTWRIVRYADDFVILVHGSEHHARALREEIAAVLAPAGLRLSAAKTSVRHMSDGFDFLGFRIQWRRKAGTQKWYVYTFIADRPVKTLKDKIRAMTRRTSQADLRETLTRLNQILRGWSAYFRHAVCTHTLKHLQQFIWWRIVRWLKTRHRWRWTAVRRHLTDHTGRWKPISVDGVTLFNLEKVGVTRYRYRGTIPSPWAQP